MTSRCLLAASALLLQTLLACAGPPVSEDPRLVVELVAREPDIVTPTGLAVDESGRVWVIENNTHERPADYHRYPSDRLRVFELDRQGQVAHVHTFADGFRNAMSVALGRDGTVYLATRSEIYRLRDTHGHGKADERQVIVRLDTPGNYPHNGLSGLTFDALGNLYFSLGENLGARYRLIGSDGATWSGGGEGGSIYHCRPDGSGLVRMATGFWNTFGLGFDAFGRLFAVGNDPDSRGPCRLLHIVPSGDYGFRFRNGRKGLHPFTAWDGELPGTLPMVAGTSEAPCAVVPYEHRGLPAEYRGQLLVTSWGDHLIERFALQPKGASFTSHARPLIRGGEDFRPVALAVAPDGSLFVSDWVDKSYPVHGKGRIWHIRWKEAPTDDGLRPSTLAKLGSARLVHLLGDSRGDIRIAAAAALGARGRTNDALLGDVLAHQSNARARAAALWAAVRLDRGRALSLLTRALGDPDAAIRGEAAWQLGQLLPADPAKRDEKALLRLAQHDPSAFVQMQALLGLRTPSSLQTIVPRLADADPFLASSALTVLGHPEHTALLRSHVTASDPQLRLGILIALRRTNDPHARTLLPTFLADAAPAVRRAAIQWVGEDRLQRFEPLLKGAATRPPVTRELFEALLATNAFLRGQTKDQETSGEQYIASIVTDGHQPAVIRALALRMLRPDDPALKTGLLRRLIASGDPGLKREAIRTLALRSDPAAQASLRQIATDSKADTAARAEAILGLGQSASEPATWHILVPLLHEPALRRDVLRSLRGTASQPGAWQAVWHWWPTVDTKALSADEKRELAEQVLLLFPANSGRDLATPRRTLSALAGSRPRDPAAWRKRLQGSADPIAGERVFFHPHGPRCYACHRIDGRGGAIGPDLSRIGQSTSRDKLIESILDPSKEIAPRFETWQLVTRDGRIHTGVILEEGPNSTITLGDTQGRQETIPRPEVEERRALSTSVMPNDLMALMTTQEFRDLLAFLQQRR